MTMNDACHPGKQKTFNAITSHKNNLRTTSKIRESCGIGTYHDMINFLFKKGFDPDEMYVSMHHGIRQEVNS